MRLLLHVCCAPCFMYPLERLKEKRFEVSGFFYNPNIHPYTEYKNRKQAVEEFNKSVTIPIEYPRYVPQEFFNAVNLKENKPRRCSLCWQIRLQETARAAKDKRFDYFSTTLLVSPYQDQGLLNTIGTTISKEEGIDFYYEDFRPGFRKAHDSAKTQGIYCQKYCGCLYSEMERYMDTKKQKNKKT